MKYALPILLLALPAPALAQQPEHPKQEAQAPTEASQADLVAGAEVRGPDGNVVGTIEEPDGEGAVVSTGSARARLPLNNFRKTQRGLIIGVTRAQFEATVNRSSS